MTTQTEVLKLALEALQYVLTPFGGTRAHVCDSNEARIVVDAYKALEKALAQPEQRSVSEHLEPVAWEPIETAPKDVMVLVCLPRQMNLVVRAWYNSIHNFWQTDYEGEGGITRPRYFHEGDLWHPIPPLYTTPPQRDSSATPHTWVGLTLDRRIELAQDVDWAAGAYCEYAEKVEAELKAKNERLEKNT